jgi:hypothetical protein
MRKAAKSALRTDVQPIEPGMHGGFWWRPDRGFSWHFGDPIPVIRRPEPARLIEAGVLEWRAGEPDGPATLSIDQGPWLTPNDAADTRYPLVRRRSVLEDMIRLGRAAPTYARTLAYANRHGPLLTPAVAVAEAPFWTESFQTWCQTACRVAGLWRMFEWVEDKSDKSKEQLSHFVVWTRQPRRVAVRVAAINGEPDAELTRRIFPDGEGWQSLVPRSAGFWGGSAELVDSHHLHGLTYGDVVGPVRRWLAIEVNRTLRGHISLAVMHVADQPIRYVPDSLRAGVFLQFALALAGRRAAERACKYENCPRGVFFAKRPNQEYCDKRCRQNAGYHRLPKAGKSRL